MEASAHPQPRPASPALISMPARDLLADGPGMARLSLMVGTIFDRLVAAPSASADSERRH